MNELPEPVPPGAQKSAAISTAADRAYTLMRESIIDGHFSAGQHLREEELARRLGVSRTPIRHAMTRLISEGMLRYTPNQGVTVRVWSNKDVHEILTIRAMLESHCAELAAQQITQAEIAELTWRNDVMAEIVRNEDFHQLRYLSELNAQFHRVIYRAARSERLAKILDELIEIPVVLQTMQTYHREQLWGSISRHSEIMNALAWGKADLAGAAMRAHVLSARATLEESPPID